MGLTIPPRNLRMISFMLSVAMLCPFGYGKIIYVDGDATGAKDGTDWANAYIYLQDALADANDSEKPVEIRVAQGIYRPDQGKSQTPADREATFQLINGVSLKGGYAGFGETAPNARETEIYETTLSGDLNTNDAGPASVSWSVHSRTDNSYHVVTGSGVDRMAELEGFTITAGNADSPILGDDPDYDYRHRRGGGIYTEHGSPKLTHCKLRVNTALHGAGMYNSSSNPMLTQCSISHNSAVVSAEDSRVARGISAMGGGMYNSGSNPTLNDCTFTDNNAIFEGDVIHNDVGRTGGGMYNDKSSPRLFNCMFSGNAAFDSGGGMLNLDSHPTIDCCTFSGNSVSSRFGTGGGMCNVASSPVIYDCTLSENAGHQGAGMFNYDSHPTLITCHFRGNAVAVTSQGPVSTPHFGEGGGMYNSGSNPTLIDCTFRGNVGYGDGGGMYNRFASRPTLANCSFSENVALSNGAGIYNADSSPSLDHCTFTGNSAHGSGGGVFNTGSNPVLTDCMFARNSGSCGAGLANDANSCPALANCLFNANSAGRGGAVHNSDESTPSVANCIFSGNSADWGGAIYSLLNSSPSMIHCTFTGNRADNAGGAICLNQDTPGDPATLVNSIVWGNVPPDVPSGSLISFSDIQGGWAGDGNVETDPLFARPGYWADVNDPSIMVEPNDPNRTWIDGDYHLLSQAGRWDPVSEDWVIDEVTSPGMDAGAPGAGGGVEPLPNGGRVNMGAYGDTLEASKSPIWQPSRAALHASNPSPPDQATGVTKDIVLQWDVGAYAATHDVYFGTADPPPFVCSQIADTFFPGELAAGTTYYWRVDEVNRAGTTTGDVWTFTTVLGGGGPPWGR